MGEHLLTDVGKTSEGIFLCFVARDFLNSKWPDVWYFLHLTIVLVLKQPFSYSAIWCLMYSQAIRGHYIRFESEYINMMLGIFSWHHRGECIQSQTSKLHVCTTNVRESGIFHGLWLYSSLISLLLGLFLYLHKNPEINYICLTFQAACCHFAICRPACPVQCGAFKKPLWLFEQRETLFSCFSPQFRAFFSLLSGLLMRLV